MLCRSVPGSIPGDDILLNSMWMNTRRRASPRSHQRKARSCLARLPRIVKHERNAEHEARLHCVGCQRAGPQAVQAPAAGKG